MPASIRATKGDDSLGGATLGATAEPGVFPLPPEYASAMEKKLKAVSELRGAVRGADLTESKKHELQVRSERGGARDPGRE